MAFSLERADRNVHIYHQPTEFLGGVLLIHHSSLACLVVGPQHRLFPPRRCFCSPLDKQFVSRVPLDEQLWGVILTIPHCRWGHLHFPPPTPAPPPSIPPRFHPSCPTPPTHRVWGPGHRVRTPVLPPNRPSHPPDPQQTRGPGLPARGVRGLGAGRVRPGWGGGSG